MSKKQSHACTHTSTHDYRHTHKLLNYIHACHRFSTQLRQTSRQISVELRNHCVRQHLPNTNISLNTHTHTCPTFVPVLLRARVPATRKRNTIRLAPSSPTRLRRTMPMSAQMSRRWAQRVLTLAGGWPASGQGHPSSAASGQSRLHRPRVTSSPRWPKLGQSSAKVLPTMSDTSGVSFQGGGF